MTDREQIHTCEICARPIYTGDKVCRFFAQIALCEAHAVKISTEIAILRSAIKGKYPPFEGEDYDEEALLELIKDAEHILSTRGDGPAFLVTA